MLNKSACVGKRILKFGRLSIPQGLHGSNDLRVGREMEAFQLFFQSRKQVVVRRGQVRRIGWVIKTMEAQLGQFLLGCKCPVSRGIVVKEQDPLGELSAAFFLQNVLQFYQQRWVTLHVDSLALWKTINEEDVVLIPKNRGRRELFQRSFALGSFGAGWADFPPLHWLLLCLRVIVIQPGFVHDYQSRQEIIWIAPKKFQICSDDRHHWHLWCAFRYFGTHFAESFRISKSSWILDPTRSCEMFSFSVIDLAEIRRSSKISSWIWSIISGVVTVLGRPGRGASQVEKSPRLNWATQFLTVAYHGTCSPNVSIGMAWISFEALPWRKTKKLDDCSRLDVV